MDIGSYVVITCPAGPLPPGCRWSLECEARRGKTGTIMETKPGRTGTSYRVDVPGFSLYWFPELFLVPKTAYKVHTKAAVADPVVSPASPPKQKAIVCDRCKCRTNMAGATVVLDLKERDLCSRCESWLTEWLDLGRKRGKIQVGDYVLLASGRGHTASMNKYVGQVSRVRGVGNITYARDPMTRVTVELCPGYWWDGEALRKLTPLEAASYAAP